MSRPRRVAPPGQPLYARALRLRNLAPSGLLCFVFLEGAVVLGILLALAELVSWWGVIVLPVTVALMVKFNDLVAGAFVPQPIATGSASARAAVVRPAVMSTPSEDVTATVVMRPLEAGRHAGFGPAGTAFTRAAGMPVPVPGTAGLYGSASAERMAGFGASAPVQVPDPAHGERPDEHMIRAAGDRLPGGGFPPDAEPAAGVRPTVMPVPGGYGPTTEPESHGYDPAAPGDGAAEAPAVGYPGSYSRGLSGTDGSPAAGGHGVDGRHQVRSAVESTVEEPRGTNAPVRRAWADELDVRQQMARQAAARRYE